MEIIAGLVLGLTGSLHCAGMCGPIAVALTGKDSDKFSFILKRVVYNSGRIVTYVLLGALFGLLGDRIKMSGLQQTISILTGVILLIGLFVSHNPFSVLMKSNLFQRIYVSYKRLIGIFFGKKSTFAFLMTGILNGFLPCGLVYLALSGALLTGDVMNSSLFMLMFGAGTIPLMLSISLFGRTVKLNYLKIRKLIPVFTIILAILFILRGLNLNIPFISPKLDVNDKVNKEVICN